MKKISTFNKSSWSSAMNSAYDEIRINSYEVEMREFEVTETSREDFLKQIAASSNERTRDLEE